MQKVLEGNVSEASRVVISVQLSQILWREIKWMVWQIFEGEGKNFLFFSIYFELDPSFEASHNSLKIFPCLGMVGQPRSCKVFYNFYVLLPYIVYVMPSGRFHIVPHFGKRAGQKVQRKIAAAVQKVKSPLLFVPLFWNQRNKLSKIILFVLVMKLTKERRRRVWRGRPRGGEIGDGEIWEGGCEYRLSLLKPNLRKM